MGRIGTANRYILFSKKKKISYVCPSEKKVLCSFTLLNPKQEPCTLSTG